MRRREGIRKRGSRWETRRGRCRLEDSDCPGGMRSEAVGVVAARVLKDLGVADAGWLQDLESGWAGTVGPVVAAHSRPGRVVGGEVHIFVDSSVWLSELQRMWKTRILELLRAKFGGDRIRSLRFVIDPGDRP